jgi:uncharacterized protein YyaL (SSP411 family)
MLRAHEVEVHAKQRDTRMAWSRTGPRMARIAEFIRGLSVMNRAATAYVYRDFHCEVPTTQTARMLELLKTK